MPPTRRRWSRAACVPLSLALLWSLSGCDGPSTPVDGGAVEDARTPVDARRDSGVDHCGNGVSDGDETGVDCGGPTCGACPLGEACDDHDDCESVYCAAGTCTAPRCDDGAHNGSETDVDCGGGTCAPCADGSDCVAPTDCTSGTCVASMCVPASCTDGARDGTETDVDCGGACAGCADGRMCGDGDDCASRSCSGGTCIAPTCTDGITNGVETDVDCGGGTCASCARGRACSLDGDCSASLACRGEACVLGPTAGFDMTPGSGTAPAVVTATSRAMVGDAAISTIEYDWDEGAGFESAAMHSYASPGSFVVQQRVTDTNGLSATTSVPLMLADSFVPVLLSTTDRTTGADEVVLLADRLTVEQRGNGSAGIRSDRAIMPGSGVYYFEGTRLTERIGAWGVGVGTSSAPLAGVPGRSTQSVGIEARGGMEAEGATCSGPAWFPAEEIDVYAMVVDYRGASPIVHFMFDLYGTLEVRRTCTMTAVTTPLYAMYGGSRTATPPIVSMNFGNDTTNHPFFHSRAELQAALTAAGHASAASALVMGFGQTRARAFSNPPVLTVSADTSIALGASVTLTASATDAEDGTLTSSILWQDVAATWFPRTGATGGSWTYTPAELGRHPIQVSVTDSFGVVTRRTVMVTVTGTLPQPDPVRLVADATGGAGVEVSPDGLRTRYVGGGKYGIRASQGIYGQYWYFEVTRLVGPVNTGCGLVTATGNLDPYDWADVPWSMSINTTGNVWRNLAWQMNMDSTATTYGFAVDYRGTHPIIHVIANGALVTTLAMDEVWVPLYPMVYGNPTGNPAGTYDHVINFGASAFVYAPAAILAGAGVSTTGLEVGWGDANTP